MRRNIFLTLMTLTLLTTLASASSINFQNQGGTCVITGPLNGGNEAGWGAPTTAGGPYTTPAVQEFCTAMEPEECTPVYHVSGVAINTTTPIDAITVNYFDGIIDADNFFMTITDEFGHNPQIIGYVFASGSMTWQEETFALPFELEADKTYYLRFEHIGEITPECPMWGQVHISSVDLLYAGIPILPEFSPLTLVLSLLGCVGVFCTIRRN